MAGALSRHGGTAAVAVTQLKPARWEGRIAEVSEHATDILGFSRHLSLGDRVLLRGRSGEWVVGEIVALHGDAARAVSFASVEGLSIGGRVAAAIDDDSARISVSDTWLGRIVDPFGRPLDTGAPLEIGPRRRPLRAGSPDATKRARLGRRMSLGVRALDLFAACRYGQRIGLFAGSGVGKSTLLAMLARNTACDVSVIAMVGERGREVREFLEDDLGREGLARSVVVVATSDASPLARRDAAYAAMTISEHFRDQGKTVLLLVDSVTRFCHALREIALSAGAAPASRGYPSTVFAELPHLLERAGPGLEGSDHPGHISAFFTVLVEGDDLSEPVADGLRGLLDGHVVLSRRIAEQGRFPAVDVARSLSRAVPTCNSLAENQLAMRARQILATHADAADLVRLGAYHAGSDAMVDEALIKAPRIEALLCQGRDERSEVSEAFVRLESALR